MRIITFNVNGIRSALKKGAFEWLAKQNADVICLQEVRASAELLKEDTFQLPGYYCYHQTAKKSGYSGVGIFSKQEPDKIVNHLGFPLSDDEGRYIHLEFGPLVVASLYLPSGTSGEGRQALKYEFLDKYLVTLQANMQSKRPHIICGDWNIAHKNIDLKNWKTNQKNSGFLPEERAWLDRLFDKEGFVDAFRVVNQEADQYTWWSHRGQAWQKNVGWRIDYQIVTPDLKQAIKEVSIYKEERFSDHAPLIIDYAI
ncbi:MAG: exodeoxyribonuclease III [Gammaproteobacteria bacterium 39-13]|nr:exodeoxyribonuclease III [Gammaproteobacteria bacterium]OJV90499.1 MAG: exodeoxyribonuclease III [Gammaproteobacteria bacterium 39-13]